MTKNQLEQEFKRAEQAVDNLLKDWKARCLTRDQILFGVLEATRLEPSGILMTSLCFTIMADRLMKLTNETKTKMDNGRTPGLGYDGAGPD